MRTWEELGGARPQKPPASYRMGKKKKKKVFLGRPVSLSDFDTPWCFPPPSPLSPFPMAPSDGGHGGTISLGDDSCRYRSMGKQSSAGLHSLVSRTQPT